MIYNEGDIVTLGFKLEGLRFYVAEYLTTHLESWRQQVQAIVNKIVTAENLEAEINSLVRHEVRSAAHALVREATRDAIAGWYSGAVRRAVERRIRRHYQQVVVDSDLAADEYGYEEHTRRCASCAHFTADNDAGYSDGTCDRLPGEDSEQLAVKAWAGCYEWRAKRHELGR